MSFHAEFFEGGEKEMAESDTFLCEEGVVSVGDMGVFECGEESREFELVVRAVVDSLGNRVPEM